MRIMLSFFALWFTACAIGQVNKPVSMITISGKVIDGKTKNPVEYATITMLQNTDIVGGTITDTKGNFTIKIPTGVYKIKISSLGYLASEIAEKTYIEDISLGEISLEINLEQLEEVIIISEKKLYEVKLDKKIYNISKDKNSKGKTFTQLLNTIPAVEALSDGTVTLRGNNNPRVLIDGNPVGMAGTNISEYLLQLPSESIDSIEIITNPSAVYDAEGVSGIINIILKKEKSNNLGIASTLSTGIPDNHGISSSVSYRKNKTSIYATGLLKYIETLGKGSIKFEYLGENEDSLSSTSQNRLDERILRLFYVNGGVFHRFDGNNSMNFSFNLGKNESNSSSAINFSDFNSSNAQIGNSERNTNENEDEFSLESNIGYTKKFKNASELSLNFEVNTSKEKEVSGIVTTINIPSPQAEIQQRVLSDQRESSAIFQADYEVPLKKENKQMRLGYKSISEFVRNTYATEQFENGTWQELTDFTDQFSSKFLINALYVQYNNSFKGLSYSVGLRAENTNQDIDFRISNEQVHKEFTDLFPSAHVSSKLGESKQIRMSYSRRIRRPETWTLNPFLSFANDRVFFSGNPNLNPIYTNSYEANYIHNTGNKLWDVAIYHQYSKGIINYIIERTEDVTASENIQFRRFPINNGNESRLGIDATSTFKLFSEFQILANVNVFNSKITNTLNSLFNANQWIWYGKLTTSATLPMKIESQLTLRYRSPRKNLSFESEAIFAGDLSFNTEIFKGNGTLAIILTDVFNTQQSVSTTSLPSFVSENNYKYRQRQLNFSFTYRLNKRKRERYLREEQLKDEFEY